MRKYPKVVVKNGRRYFFRFSAHQRVQHATLFTTVILLSLTGFPLKYHDQPWAEPIYNFFGGIEVAPMIHRLVGSVLLGLFVYHTIYWMMLFYKNKLKPLYQEGNLGLKTGVKAFFSQEMVPTKKDFFDIVDLFKYLLYISPNPPKHERMSWKEKFDYYAPYWGIPILGPVGVLLWFRDEVTHYVPGIVLNAGYIMHTDEALLAAIFLFFVHWYNVHYSPEKFPMATVFMSGYLSEEEMVHEHYAQYVRVMKEEGLEDEIRPQHSH